MKWPRWLLRWLPKQTVEVLTPITIRLPDALQWPSPIDNLDGFVNAVHRMRSFVRGEWGEAPWRINVHPETVYLLRREAASREVGYSAFEYDRNAMLFWGVPLNVTTDVTEGVVQMARQPYVMVVPR